MYEKSQVSWRTPNGNPATFWIREGTNDWNTVNSCMGPNDEYGIAGREIRGDVLDVGGYLGSVGVTIAIDNPHARVFIVEPVPDNAALIRANAEANEVTDRVTVFEGAVGRQGVHRSEVWYGYRGSEVLEHHAYVGNTSLAYDHGGEAEHQTATVDTLGLAALLATFNLGEVAYAKIDCEGAEWAFLDAATDDLRLLPYIVGEAHAVRGHKGRDIIELLAPTHDVTLQGDGEGTCNFVAVLR